MTLALLLLLACGAPETSVPPAPADLNPNNPGPAPDAPPPNPDAPAELCPDRRTPGCFVPVAPTTATVGAQADDPSAPHHDPLAAPDEGPVRSVTLAPLWLQRTEAPAWQYDRCVGEGFCTPPAVSTDRSPEHPVTGVSFEQATAFCAWLGGRVPTEDEWEAIARAGDDRRFPWGAAPRCPYVDAAGLEAQASAREATARACGLTGPRITAVLDVTAQDRLGPVLDHLAPDTWGAACAAWSDLDDAALRTAVLQRLEAEEARLAAAGVLPTCPPTDLRVAAHATPAHPLGLAGLAGNAAEWVVSTLPHVKDTHMTRGGSFASPPAAWRTSARSAREGPSEDVGIRCIRHHPI